MSQHQPQQRGPLSDPLALHVGFGPDEQRDAFSTSARLPVANTKGDLDKILHVLSSQNNSLSGLARDLLTSNPTERRALLNCPLKGSRLLPLFVAARWKWDHRGSKLTRDEVKSLPRLMVKEGADPLMRDARGRIPLLAEGLATDTEVLRTLVEARWTQLALRLTRDEKIWLCCRTKLAFYGTPSSSISDALIQNIFRGGVDLAHHRSYRGLRHLARNRERFCPFNGAAREVFLQSIETLVDCGALSKRDSEHVLNTAFDSKDELMIHAIAREKHHAENLLPLIKRLGASASLPSGKRSVIPGGSALHFAAYFENLSLFSAHEMIGPPLLTLQDQEGNTPLHTYLAKSHHLSLNWIAKLSDSPRVLSIQNKEGERPLDIALKRNDVSVIQLLRSQGATTSLSREGIAKLNFIDQHDAFFKKAGFGAQNAAMRALARLDPSLRPIFIEAFAGIANAQAFHSKARPAQKTLLSSDAPETALTRALPKAMLAPSPEILVHLALIIDNEPLSGDFLTHRSFHPHEAELLAMLAYPGSVQFNRDEIKPIALGLTSTRRFDRREVPEVSLPVVELWSQIGSLGFEFLNLKYDARTFLDATGRKQTLLGAYGFIRSDGGKRWYDKSYSQLRRLFGGKPTPQGASWFIRGDMTNEPIREERFQSREGIMRIRHRSDPSIEAMVYRTHMRIFHPEHGEVIIRNSAPDGGRDSLLHPAYIIGPKQRKMFFEPKREKGLEYEWSFRQIERYFSEILNPRLYPKGELGPELMHAKFLIEQYRTLMHGYRSWAFDLSPTGAYVDDPNTEERFLVGAYKSKGFPIMLQALRYWVQAGESLEIACCRKHFPAWDEYCSLRCTEANLEELEYLADGDFSSPFLHDSGVFDFIQKGLFSFGDLIIRSASLKEGRA